jgi:hypothetical protein
VIGDRPVHALDAAGERDAARRGAALARDVRAEIAAGGGASVTFRLPRGTPVDAFGQESGSVLFPFGVPFGARGLPPAARTASGYRRYRVVRPLPVTASLSAPAAGGPGGGVRFTLSAGLFPRPPALPTVRWLLRAGYVERLTGASVPR